MAYEMPEPVDSTKSMISDWSNMMNKQELIYKTMNNTGAMNIAFGVLVAATGITAGTVLIVTGAKLLLRKRYVEF